MQAKTGGALAIGTVAVAITYATSVFQTSLPPNPARGPASTAASNSAGSVNDRLAYDSVKVFYATDRAFSHASQSARQLELGVAGFATVFGLVAFAIWFAQHGHKKTSIAIGGLAGTIGILTLIAMPAWKIKGPRPPPPLPKTARMSIPAQTQIPRKLGPLPMRRRAMHRWTRQIRNRSKRRRRGVLLRAPIRRRETLRERPMLSGLTRTGQSQIQPTPIGTLFCSR